MNKPPLIVKYLCHIAKAAQRDSDFEDMERQHNEIVAEIFREGNEDCPHHMYANLGVIKRDCSQCWSEIKSKYTGGRQ